MSLESRYQTCVHSDLAIPIELLKCTLFEPSTPLPKIYLTDLIVKGSKSVCKGHSLQYDLNLQNASSCFKETCTHVEKGEGTTCNAIYFNLKKVYQDAYINICRMGIHEKVGQGVGGHTFMYFYMI